MPAAQEQILCLRHHQTASFWFQSFSFYLTKFHILQASQFVSKSLRLGCPASISLFYRQTECCRFLHPFRYFRSRIQLFLSHSNVYILLPSVETFYLPFPFNLISVQYSSSNSVSNPEAWLFFKSQTVT